MKVIRFFLRHLWFTSALLITLAALAVVLLRIFLPQATHFRPEVENIIGMHLGRPVTIGSLEMEWLGGGPALRLRSVSLLSDDGRKPLIQLDSLYLTLDTLSLIRDRKLRVGRFTLSGIKLSLRRDRQGRISIEGMETSLGGGGGGGGEENIALARWLLTQPRLGLLASDLEWRDELLGRDLSVTDMNLELANEGDRHRLSGSLTLPPALGTFMSTVWDFEGDLWQPQQWSGRFYFKGQNLHISSDWPIDALRKGGVRSVGADVEVWSHWERGELQRWSADIGHAGLELAAGDCPAPEVGGAEGGGQCPHEVVSGIGGRLFWRRHPQGWLFDGEGIRLTHAGRQWPDTDFSMVLARDDDGWAVVGNVDHVEVTTAAALLRAVGAMEVAQRTLIGSAEPGGSLNDLRVEFARHDDGSEPDFSLSGAFEGLSMKAAGPLPGISGISGRFSGTLAQGSVQLSGEGFDLALPTLFRDPLRLERAEGALFWRRAGDQLVVESPDLMAINRDIATRSRFALTIPLEGGAPFLDLRSAFADGDATTVPRYLPALIMPQGAVAWLDRAFTGGRVPYGDLLVHGRVDDFPFDNGTGRFAVRFQAEDVTLDYQRSWPVLRELDGDVAFVNRSFEAQGRGAMLGGRVEQVRAAIDDLVKADYLTLDGAAQADGDDLLKIMRETTLADGIGGYFKGVESHGPASLGLHAQVALDSTLENRVSGEVRFAGTDMSLDEWHLALTGLDGAVTFDGDGIRTQGLKARLSGRDVTLDAAPLAKGKGTRFTARGAMDAEELAGDYLPQLKPFVKGVSPWDLDIALVEGKSLRVELEARSDLAGTEVTLPEPMGKAAGLPRPVALSLTIGEGGLRDHVTFSYGELLSGRVAVRPQGAWRGSFMLGPGKPPALPAEGVEVAGHLTYLPLDRWRTLLASLDGGKGAVMPAAHFKVDVDELLAEGHTFPAVSLDGGYGADGTTLVLDSPRAKGELTLDTAGERLKARFTRLHLDEGTATPEGERPDPRQLPELQLHADDFLFGEMALGVLDLRTRPQPDGMALDLTLAAPSFSARGEGSWRIGEAGETSTFDARLESEALGRALAALGYVDTLEGGEGHMAAQVSWSGAPADFSSARISGDLEMAFYKGRFLNISPGAGRVFGLLSVQALPRRLSLDFSDLFKQGFSFDTVSGHFRVDSGIAYTNTLSVDGPPARVEVNGSVDLGAKLYDQTVTITPHFSANLPLAGLLAGEPVLGAVLLIADKLFSSSVDRTLSVQYRVDGPWDDPRVERLNGEAEEIARDANGPATELMPEAVR